MKILYLGKNHERARELTSLFGRESCAVDYTDRPEHAYFKILHGKIAALCLDLASVDGDCGEVIHSLTSLDADVEIVLIAESHQLVGLSDAVLASCFGVLNPNLSDRLNRFIARQLTEKLSIKNRLETLKSSAVVDGLTQLYNHGFIQQQMDEEIRVLGLSGESLSLVMVDVDHFKNYNDTNGHPAGDQVLRQVATLLEGTVRKFDFAARYGGEEFALVLPCCSLVAALNVAERVRLAIAGHNFLHREKQPLGVVSASLGVAALDHQDVADKATLLERADQALYRAKRNGRNCVWFFRGGEFQPYRSGLAG